MSAYCNDAAFDCQRSSFTIIKIDENISIIYIQKKR